MAVVTLLAINCLYAQTRERAQLPLTTSVLGRSSTVHLPVYRQQSPAGRRSAARDQCRRRAVHTLSARGTWGVTGCAPGNEHQSTSDRRSEEHTSELQSLRHLVCRLLL